MVGIEAVEELVVWLEVPGRKMRSVQAITESGGIRNKGREFVRVFLDNRGNRNQDLPDCETGAG